MSGDGMTRFRCVMLRRSGTSEIRVVRAPDAAAARAALEARGLQPVSVEAIGPSLFDVLAAKARSGDWRWPRRHVEGARGPTAIASGDVAWRAALILATIPLTTAILAWGWAGIDMLRVRTIERRDAEALAMQARLAAVERARHGVERVAGVPPLSAIAAQLADVLPEGASVEAMSLTPEAELLIEIDTADPDQLRATLAADPLLASLGEVDQSRTDAGTIRVSLKGRLR